MNYPKTKLSYAQAEQFCIAGTWKFWSPFTKAVVQLQQSYLLMPLQTFRDALAETLKQPLTSVELAAAFHWDHLCTIRKMYGGIPMTLLLPNNIFMAAPIIDNSKPTAPAPAPAASTPPAAPAPEPIDPEKYLRPTTEDALMLAKATTEIELITHTKPPPPAPAPATSPAPQPPASSEQTQAMLRGMGYDFGDEFFGC